MKIRQTCFYYRRILKAFWSARYKQVWGGGGGGGGAPAKQVIINYLIHQIEKSWILSKQFALDTVLYQKLNILFSSENYFKFITHFRSTKQEGQCHLKNVKRLLNSFSIFWTLAWYFSFTKNLIVAASWLVFSPKVIHTELP